MVFETYVAADFNCVRQVEIQERLKNDLRLLRYAAFSP